MLVLINKLTSDLYVWLRNCRHRLREVPSLCLLESHHRVASLSIPCCVEPSFPLWGNLHPLVKISIDCKLLNPVHPSELGLFDLLGDNFQIRIIDTGPSFSGGEQWKLFIIYSGNSKKISISKICQRQVLVFKKFFNLALQKYLPCCFNWQLVARNK